MESPRVVRVLVITREPDLVTRIRHFVTTQGGGGSVHWVVESVDRFDDGGRPRGADLADVILLDFSHPVQAPEELLAEVATNRSPTPLIALVPPGDSVIRPALTRHGITTWLSEEQVTSDRLERALESAEQQQRVRVARERAAVAVSQHREEMVRCDRLIRVAREVSHALNNELSRTLGYLELLALLHRDDETRQMTEDAIAGITVAAENIGRLQKTVHQIVRERTGTTSVPSDWDAKAG